MRAWPPGLALSGCIPVAVTAGATTAGVVTAQERSAGNAVDDAGIKLTIDNLYFNHDINDLFKNVNIHVSEGRVLMPTGAANKPETKALAEKLAWQARGVREVINEIQVSDKSGIVDYARDTWISRADTQPHPGGEERALDQLHHRGGERRGLPAGHRAGRGRAQEGHLYRKHHEIREAGGKPRDP